MVEEETWKNKVLEIPEQAETCKFLSKAQAEEESSHNKKLIEEIDEDDYVEKEQPTQKDDEE
jgi:hypothetical protein